MIPSNKRPMGRLYETRVKEKIEKDEKFEKFFSFS